MIYPMDMVLLSNNIRNIFEDSSKTEFITEKADSTALITSMKENMKKVLEKKEF